MSELTSRTRYRVYAGGKSNLRHTDIWVDVAWDGEIGQFILTPQAHKDIDAAKAELLGLKHPPADATHRKPPQNPPKPPKHPR